MKRMHVHVSVNDLPESIRFYSTLFAAEPAVTKPDYAKWLLDDPRVNFAISTGASDAHGIEHLGIQVENEAELAEVYGRLEAADRPVLAEGATVCCYAKSEKSWIADPQVHSSIAVPRDAPGIGGRGTEEVKLFVCRDVWETFYTSGEAVNYGANPELHKLASDNAAPNACCAPAIETKPATSCCG